MLGKLGAEGLGAPGVAIKGGAFGASPTPAGIGCLGPDKICPGLGAGGMGLEGIAEPRTGLGADGLGAPGVAAGAGACATGGAGGCCGAGGATRGVAACGNGIDGGENDCPAARGGCPVDNGGRSGGARRTGAAGASSACFVSGVSFTACSTRGASAFGADGLCAGCARTGSGTVSALCETPRDSAGAGAPPVPPCTRRLTCSATSSSSELECVFLSAMPSSANVSRMTLGFTSSSRASSLMRILLIR
jgi:hypothetical protein